MPKLNTLNRRQQLFCQYLAEGESQARSYLKAGFKANTIQQAGSNAIRLMRTERVASYLGKIKEIVFKNQVLSFNEKRAIISRMVKAAPSEVGADSMLAQSYTEEVDVQGNVKRKVVLPDKARLIDLDNRMAGDNFADRSPQVSNPFTLIIALGKTPAQGQALDDARQAASVGSLPHPPLVMDAEIVSDDATT